MNRRPAAAGSTYDAFISYSHAADGALAPDELDDLVMELFMENPLLWTSEVLARKFHLSKPRVEAIIWMKRMEAELSPEEFRAKVHEAKDKAQREMDAQAAKLAEAEAAGNEKEAARLKKRIRQEEEATQPDGDDELDAREEAVLMGIDDDATSAAPAWSPTRAT